MVFGFNVFAEEDKLRKRIKSCETFLEGTKFLVKEREPKEFLEVIDHETEKLRSIARGERSPTTGRPLPYIAHNSKIINEMNETLALFNFHEDGN